MSFGYTNAYTPVIRNPRLFHQNSGFSQTHYQGPPNTAQLPSDSYSAYSSYYMLQNTARFQAPLSYYPQSYPFYPPYNSAVSSSIPFSSYSDPTLSYIPSDSSNGLSIILIAILILVALDLIIVRPQKIGK